MARNNIMNYKGIPINLDVISSDMVEDSLKELKELFFIEGCYSPIIRWCITSQSDWPKSHRTLFSFWKSRPTYPFNPQHMVSEEELQPMKDSLLVANFHEDRNDFSYAWIGANLKAANYPFKENRSLFQSAEHEGGVTSLFHFSCLGACALRMQPLLTMYQQTTPTSIQVWSTLLVPFMDARGKPTGFASSVVYSK